MGRKSFNQRREIDPDPKFHDIVVAKFINAIMRCGERSLAERIFYHSLDIAQERTGEEGLKLFKKALDNVKPVLEVKSRRVGGANYQVPIEVKPARRQSLASRWLIDAASARPEGTMDQRLAAELIEASNGRGGAMKKREHVHKMAEANKAFSHFRW